MRGGDKALLRRKAKAKARRYAPLIKNVDESSADTASCLTGFVNDFAPATAGRMVKAKMLWCGVNLSAKAAHILAGATSGSHRDLQAESHQQEIDQRDQGGSDAGGDQDVIGPEATAQRIEGGSGGFPGHYGGLGQAGPVFCEADHTRSIILRGNSFGNNLRPAELI